MDPSNPETVPVEGQDPATTTADAVRDDDGDHGNVDEGLTHLKFLVDRRQCGPLIGRGGSHIKELQTTTGTVVRISNNKDCYPGTSSRVVLIRGDAALLPDAIVKVLDSAEVAPNDDGTPAPPQLGPDGRSISSTVEIVIPLTAAGVIIGKGGENIRKMQADFDCSMRLSPLSDITRQFSERLLTITNKTDIPPLDACRHVVSLLIEHPDTFVYRNTTTAYPHYQMDSYQQGMMYQRGMMGKGYQGSYGSQMGYQGARGMYGDGSGLHQQQRRSDQFQSGSSYRGSHSSNPYSDGQSQGYAMGQGQGSQGYNAYYGTQQGQGQNSGSKYGYMAYGQDPYAQQGSTAVYGGMGQGQQMGRSDGQFAYQQLFVPDASVGLIVGRGGEKIRNVNSTSGARVQISQKGEYKPGTTNRIITISGQPANIQTAIDMIHQLLQGASQ